MTKTRKPHRTREFDTKDGRDKITLKPPSFRPTKVEVEDVISLEESLGVPVETFGKTPEEQMRNLVRHQFRQVKFRYAK